jgi:hypothetical protein
MSDREQGPFKPYGSLGPSVAAILRSQFLKALPKRRIAAMKRTPHVSLHRFDKFPKHHVFLGSGAVPIIPVSLAFRSSPTGAMHPAYTKTAHRRRLAPLPCSL